MQRLLIAVGIIFLLASLPLALLGIVTGLKDGHVHCCYTDMRITPEVTKLLSELQVTDAQLETYLNVHSPRAVLPEANAPDARDQLSFAVAQMLVPQAKQMYVEKVRTASILAFVAAAVSLVSGSLLLTSAWHNNRLRRNFMYPRCLA
jgi:hypothetical protein